MDEEVPEPCLIAIDPCPGCEGSGRLDEEFVPYGSSTVCPECRGRGWIEAEVAPLEICENESEVYDERA